MSCPRDACASEYTRSEIERTCPASTPSETTATSTKEKNGITRIIYTSVSYSGIVAERIASQIRNFEIVNWTVGDAKSNLILSNLISDLRCRNRAISNFLLHLRGGNAFTSWINSAQWRSEHP